MSPSSTQWPCGVLIFSSSYKKIHTMFNLSHPSPKSQHIIALLDKFIDFLFPCKHVKLFFSDISCLPCSGVHALSMPRSIVWLFHEHCLLWESPSSGCALAWEQECLPMLSGHQLYSFKSLRSPLCFWKQYFTFFFFLVAVYPFGGNEQGWWLLAPHFFCCFPFSK